MSRYFGSKSMATFGHEILDTKVLHSDKVNTVFFELGLFGFCLDRPTLPLSELEKRCWLAQMQTQISQMDPPVFSDAHQLSIAVISLYKCSATYLISG